ncbi:hypothetical protein C1I98_13350 [Spongiactinospora gelatinilytica]|uniref:Uncharacterized protein n=1 Tax=Spongiactinospora gelatinilytica TaxID=2666298 RepID=A0A2W2GHW9_9ACTN|nr:hypothetical protein [Spongiactinospora gelatinilytica]PZG47452.1 hypothetical protein C1I98_13350 [Spongiactinospora gelatinilytica]
MPATRESDPQEERLAPHVAQLCDVIITARLHLAELAGGSREADRLVRARMREILGGARDTRP